MSWNPSSSNGRTAEQAGLRPEEVLRGEPFSLEHLELHATALARQFASAAPGRGDRTLVDRASESGRLLKQVYRELSAAVEAGELITRDAEWLLDNFSVVEDQLREIREDLSPGFYRDLPKTLAGRPRVYELSVEVIIHTDSALDEDTLVRFLQAFQETTPLTIGEIWAFPIMLRLSLIENLRRLAVQMRSDRQCRAGAAAQWQAAEFEDLDWSSPERCAPLVLELLEQLQEQGSESEPLWKSLERKLAEQGLSADEIVRIAHQRQASNQVSIGNVITSMRLISALDWTAFFERTSLAERSLRQDPAGVYPAMDIATRNRCRHVVEQLARHSQRKEEEIVDQALVLARDAKASSRPAHGQHVGYYLIDAGRTHLERAVAARLDPGTRCRRFVLHWALPIYLGAIGAMTLISTAGVMAAVRATDQAWWLAILLGVAAILPASELAVSLVNFLVAHLVPPRILPKLELRDGIPEESATLVVVPALLTSRAEIESLVQRLELHFLCNPEPALRLALLTDFVDGDQPSLPQDDELLQLARAAIRGLNERYGTDGDGPFLLLHRARKWNSGEQKWMGWERKRGKLMELNRLLLGDGQTTFEVREGNVAAIAGSPGKPSIKYVITLDSDTQLPPGAARQLIGTLAHPLNRPRFGEGGQIVGGYAILQPRVGVHLSAANRSWYARAFANSPGIDPYATAASDVYQDLFAEGSFTGKGIYDVEAFERSLAGVFPENHILSHDLIEGCHSRVGLVSDIELIDGFPSRYDAEARRQHRWARGDWQLLPWLLPRVPAAGGWRTNRLSLLARWKILDNLRRSLVPLACLMLLGLGSFLCPPLAPLWVGLLFLLLGFPLLAQVAATLRHWPRGRSWTEYRRAWTEDLGRSLAQTLVLIAMLPHRACYLTDAVLRTLVRLFVTRRHLLEWEPAAATEQRLSQSQWSILSGHWVSPVIAVALLAFLPMAAKLWTLPLAIAWIAAPLVAWWISRPIAAPALALGAEQQNWLRRVTLRTWSFFERFVTEDDNWLPPDNFQEYPQDKVAHRISPTNEGLFLVSALVARDFGYIGLFDLTELWERNLASWGQLERLRGHFINWYDTTTLEPLQPRYVSTVDSGNLAASLMTLRQGIEELRAAPIFGPEQWQGVLDHLGTIELACRELHPPGARLVSPPLEELCEAIGMLSVLRDPPQNLAEWRARLKAAAQQAQDIDAKTRQLVAARAFPWSEVPDLVGRLQALIRGLERDFELLYPWMDNVVHTPSERRGQAWEELLTKLRAARSPAALRQLPEQIADVTRQLRRAWNEDAEQSSVQDALEWLASLENRVSASADAASQLEARLLALASQADTWAREMDFGFLYNPQRRLFAIGFNIEDGQLDRAHYDLLASEARLASYLAIAKGDVDHETWFRMSRPITQAAGRVCLLSWGGTIFEYLMPQLFQRQFEGSLLAQSCQAAVARQIEFGRQKQTPWGVSECAFAALASNSDYHYRSFGVPGLGMKRGLAKDLVVSPYATFLALENDVQAACENLRLLEKEGAWGRWGYFDAVDYTPERMPSGKRHVPVRCYMAHHQGMILAALANLLDRGSVRRRFHSHPLGRAAELLLQERAPAAAPLVEVHESHALATQAPRAEGDLVSRRLSGHQTATPRTHLLSNGQYSVMLTNTGGGYSRYRDLAVTRWRCDPTCDHWGQFIYLREVGSGRVWSATYQPTRSEPDAYHVTYSIDKAEYHRRDGPIETHLEVTVSPENHAEMRQLKLTNYGPEAVEIEVTSYAEVVLAPPATDDAHPAFHKLFVETEYIPDELALLARRRPRDSSQPTWWAVHVLAPGHAGPTDVQFESSRAKFIGRGRTTAAPAALDPMARLGGAAGAVLDPIFALRTRVAIGPNESAILAFTTAVAASREEALNLADQFHELRVVQRAFEMAWAFSQVELRHLHLSPTKAHQFQRLASPLLYPDAAWRAETSVLAANRQGQSGLWRYGISGDLPLMVARVTKPEQLDVVRDLLMAHLYWRRHGLAADLAIVNDHPGSYLDALQDQLVGLVNDVHRQSDVQPVSVFLLRGAQIPREDQVLLEAAAAVIFRCQRGSLARQLETTGVAQATPMHPTPALPPAAAAGDNEREVQRPPRKTGARGLSDKPRTFWNGWGGFVDGGRTYQIDLSGQRTTPQPWSNVIANPRFGCLVTESGGGHTWAENSREFKLTSWANDPVGDPPAEWLFLRDEQSGEIMRPLPQPGRQRNAEYVTEHSSGQTTFRYASDEWTCQTQISIAADDPVKFIVVSLHNRGRAPKWLALTFAVEWVLGVDRRDTQRHVATLIDETTGALLAVNRYHPEFAGHVAFLHCLATPRTVTGDRAEFVGRNGTPAEPVALHQKELSGRTGQGLDPCGAVQTRLSIGPGERAEVVFMLGAGADVEEVRSILNRYRAAAQVHAEIARQTDRWRQTLTAIQVRTPNPALDLLVNQWLIYQTLSCRLWARSGYYQSAGAYGFRDQLQDVMALVYSRPDLAREHLLRAAARQFEEGDVQHWWHAPTGRGTRTRFSDDYLWLPLVAAHYARITGDKSILEATAPLLRSSPLEPHEHERYELPTASGQEVSLYEHCRRTLARAFRLGPHGLPLMGCGDWNDGMNKVGALGQGESVWVGWFLLVILREFLPLMRERGDRAAADALADQAIELRQNLEAHAWDGQWYRRAYFDDGTPLGSIHNDECQIDSLSQSWAVFAGANPDRCSQAMESVWQRLVRKRDRLVLLLTPPFDRTALDPGYIKGYVPGIRENGGQYTHAALWTIQALATLDDAERAIDLLDTINPIWHTATPDGVSRYEVEPYVVAADVYGVPPHTGRGGWTWYTGSAAWMYRVILESILGFELRGDRLRIRPCTPADWPEFEIQYRRGNSTYKITFCNGPNRASPHLSIDGEPAEGDSIRLVDDGMPHEVLVDCRDRHSPRLSGEGSERSAASRVG